MNFTARIIADLLKGTIEGDPEASVSDVSKIEEGKPGSLSFLANPKYEKYIYQTESSIVIVNKDFTPAGKVKSTLIRVENAYEAFAKLLDLYEQTKPVKKGVENMAAISNNARLGKDVYVGEFTVVSAGAIIGDHVQLYPQVYIGSNVTIGDHTILYPGVKIYHDCTIGKNCIIHAGAVIGADGFGFAPDENNQYKKIPQVGSVIIEDNVEIGANTTIDRATMGATIIRKGVKLDNLIMVGHNVEIGQNTVIAGQSGIAGSSKVGENCMFGGQVGLAGHISVADNIKIGAQSGLSKSFTKEGLVLLGSPAHEVGPYSKSLAVFRNLPELRNQVLELERELKSLKEKRDSAE